MPQFRGAEGIFVLERKYKRKALHCTKLSNSWICSGLVCSRQDKHQLTKGALALPIEAFVGVQLLKVCPIVDRDNWTRIDERASDT